MQRRDEGHPLAAMLLLASMFAFTFVFHAVTQPAAKVPVRYDHQLTPLAVPSASESPSFDVPLAIASSPSSVAIMAVATEIPIAVPASPPLLDAFTWPTLAALPVAVSASAPSEAGRGTGALTRAIATGGAALRHAFKRAF